MSQYKCASGTLRWLDFVLGPQRSSTMRQTSLLLTINTSLLSFPCSSDYSSPSQQVRKANYWKLYSSSSWGSDQKPDSSWFNPKWKTLGASENSDKLKDEKSGKTSSALPATEYFGNARNWKLLSVVKKSSWKRQRSCCWKIPTHLSDENDPERSQPKVVPAQLSPTPQAFREQPPSGGRVCASFQHAHPVLGWVESATRDWEWEG